MTFVGFNALKCISMNNQECQIRSEITDVNRSKPEFYPYSLNMNKCIASCNNIDELISRTNEMRHV